MSDINSVFFGGRLTDDPRPIGSGCKFDVASNRVYNKDGERNQITTFMPVTVWGPQASTVLKYMRKGSSVLVEGRLDVHKFDRKDGTKGKETTLIARDVHFMDKPQRAGVKPTMSEDVVEDESSEGEEGLELLQKMFREMSPTTEV